MSDINDPSKKTSVDPKSPSPEPEPTELKPASESPDGDPAGTTCLPPPRRDPVRHLPHVEPDLVLAAQREDLHKRADLCDPVLRQHIGLPPLPDAHEKERRRAEAWKRRRKELGLD